MTMKTVTFPSEVADTTSLNATHGRHASRLVSSCKPRAHSALARWLRPSWCCQRFVVSKTELQPSTDATDHARKTDHD